MSARLPAPELGPKWNESARLLRVVAVQVRPAAWREVRNYIAAVADKERTEALAEGRRYADQVRRELGLPTRLEESLERARFDLQVDFRRFADLMDTAARDLVAKFERRCKRPANEIWSDAVAPGGYVCAECGMPVESEPCAEHGGAQ